MLHLLNLLLSLCSFVHFPGIAIRQHQFQFESGRLEGPLHCLFPGMHQQDKLAGMPCNSYSHLCSAWVVFPWLLRLMDRYPNKVHTSRNDPGCKGIEFCPAQQQNDQKRQIFQPLIICPRFLLHGYQGINLLRRFNDCPNSQ